MAALAMTARVDEQPRRLFADVIDELAQAYGEAPALLSHRENFSFGMLADRSNLYSRWALAQGLGPGRTVALLLPNRPDYLAAWIGITRIGAVVALLDINLVGAALAHCVDVAAPSHAIVAADRLAAWRSAEPLLALSTPPALWLYGEGDPALPRINRDLLSRSGTVLSQSERPPLTTADRALLVYTSGAAGLPKAAHVTHHRVMMGTHWLAGMMLTSPSDRLYDCLSLCHGVAGMVAPGAVLVNGGSVVIAEQFSASRFWDEAIRWDCSLLHYIGELCRDLMKSAPAEAETVHQLRMICGSGLRPDVWEEFKARFAIPQILEFYAPNEGNFTL
jgi:fatty-acyl-CoA synthase